MDPAHNQLILCSSSSQVGAWNFRGQNLTPQLSSQDAQRRLRWNSWVLLEAEGNLFMLLKITGQTQGAKVHLSETKGVL